MLERIRDTFAIGLLALANRVSGEPRFPGGSRVASGMRTLAGVAITPDTAVTISAVWACLRYLSQTVAVLPWHVFKDGERGAEIQKRNPLDYLVSKRVSDEWSSFQFRETLTHWALRWGNGYAEIEPDQLDRPYALHPIHPERMEVCRAIEAFVTTGGDEVKRGELYYECSSGGSGDKITLAAKRVFHLRGFGEGPVGVNVINYASQSLGWVRAAQLFGATFFGNGMNVSGVVTLKKPLKEAGLKRMQEEMASLYCGVNRSNKVAFLDNEADFKPITVDAQKSQMIETHQHLVEEVCRWFGVPPHKIMHLLRATFSNIEHQAIEVVIDSVTPWVKRFEDEADFKLFGKNRQFLFTKMNMRALLRGDTTARIAYLTGMRNIGAYTVNDVLRVEDENTIGPEGDKHTMQSGFTTLKRIGEEPVKALPAPTDPVDDDADQEAVARLEQMVSSGMKVIEHV